MHQLRPGSPGVISARVCRRSRPRTARPLASIGRPPRRSSSHPAACAQATAASRPSSGSRPCRARWAARSIAVGGAQAQPDAPRSPGRRPSGARRGAPARAAAAGPGGRQVDVGGARVREPPPAPVGQRPKRRRRRPQAQVGGPATSRGGCGGRGARAARSSRLRRAQAPPPRTPRRACLEHRGDRLVVRTRQLAGAVARAEDRPALDGQRVGRDVVRRRARARPPPPRRQSSCDWPGTPNMRSIDTSSKPAARAAATAAGPAAASWLRPSAASRRSSKACDRRSTGGSRPRRGGAESCAASVSPGLTSTVISSSAAGRAAKVARAASSTRPSAAGRQSPGVPPPK